MKLSECQRSWSFFDLGQRSLRFQSQIFDFWSVYSGERFRASWPSCLKLFLLNFVIVFSIFISTVARSIYIRTVNGYLKEIMKVDHTGYILFMRCNINCHLLQNYN